MRELSREFIGKGQVRGFLFTQIKKNEYCYIYKVEDNGRIWYEIFEHRENKRFNCISYPRNKSFSIWAFTYLSLERALTCFDELTITVEMRKESNNV